MQANLLECLRSFGFGDAQAYKNIVILPLFAPGDESSQYLTLDEAFKSGRLVITEVSQAGSVPEIRTVNSADQPVLLLDGEELLGARQNRVLNTTILLKERSETVIPVTCTEAGRWGYESVPHFSTSGSLLEYKIRSKKLSSVSKSLVSAHKYESDQREVWSGIARLQRKSKLISPTHAMHDLFVARESEFRQALEVFVTVPLQTGLFVFVDGEVAGFDTVSSTAAYTQLHPKLVKSYIFDPLLGPKDILRDHSREAEKAAAFIESTRECGEQVFPSAGYGADYRYQGNTISGSALLHEDRVVHTAFFNENRKY